MPESVEHCLRASARSILRAALAAVDPEAAVRRHLRVSGSRLFVGDPACPGPVFDLEAFDRVLVVGAGKAGAPMAAAAAGIFGKRLTSGLVVTKYGHTLAKPGRTGPVEITEAAHPVPDDAGVEAGLRIVRLLEGATARDLVLCLLSGGGSALLTAPAEGIFLDDLRQLTPTLLACGAPIHDINTVRKHLSRVKGGQLARLAAPAPVISLILSDVVGDPLDVIASGPTVPDPTTFADSQAVLERYNVMDAVPASVRARLAAGAAGKTPDTPKPGDPLFERVLNVLAGNNRRAALAAVDKAARCGFRAVFVSDRLQGEARRAGRVLAGLARSLAVALQGRVGNRTLTLLPGPEPAGPVQTPVLLPSGAALPENTRTNPPSQPVCLVLGGETTVTLQGNGLGGRNQETALAAAVELDGLEGVLVASVATDGGDGPTEAAGAFADGATVRRARALGLDPAAHLDRNDSHPFFTALGDLVVTGPTRTNVNDLVLVMVGTEGTAP